MADLRNEIRDEILDTYLLAGSSDVRIVLYTAMPTVVTGEDGTELVGTGYTAGGALITFTYDVFGKVKLTADVTVGTNSSGSDWLEIVGFGITTDGAPGGPGTARLFAFAVIYGGVVVPNGSPLKFSAGVITASLS